jgi:hypothetical protein
MVYPSFAQRAGYQPGSNSVPGALHLPDFSTTIGASQATAKKEERTQYPALLVFIGKRISV